MGIQFSESPKKTERKRRVSFSDIADAWTGDAPQYDGNQDPAEQMLQDLYSWIERPGVEEERNAHRAPGLHASSLHRVCARREILAQDFKLVVERQPMTVGNFLTVDVGHALHQWWQDEYLGPSGLAFGNWRCKRCHHLHKDTTCPKKCFHPCESEKFTYEEYGVDLKDLKTVGHMDAVLLEKPWDKRSKKRVGEIKTKSPYQYKHISGPELAHVIQTHVYMKGMGLTEAIIIYIAKGKQCKWTIRSGEFIAGSPRVKAYVVGFDDALWASLEKRINDYWQAQADIQELKDGLITSLDASSYDRVCPTATCDMAKACALREVCFAVED